MRRRVYPCLSHALALSLLATIWAPITMAQTNVQGQWSTLPYLMPINPVHVALLSNGKVLVVAGSGYYTSLPDDISGNGARATA